MDRRSFIRSFLFAGAAVAAGAALLPAEAQAASLMDTLKDMERAPAPDLPAPDAQEAQRRGRRVVVHRRVIVRRRAVVRRRTCVTRVGPRGRVRRICRFG